MLDNVARTALFGSAPEIFSDVDLSAGAAGGRPLGAASWFRAVSVVDALEDRREKIEADTNLSREGRQRALSRAVRDVRVDLGKVAANRDQLGEELEAARAACRPEGEPDQTVMAAIWPRLPDNHISVKTAFGDALARSDFETCSAILSLPTVFEGCLPVEDLAELKRELVGVQAPKVLAAMDAAETTWGAVDSALNSASQFVDDLAQGLPEDPADGDKVVVGDDGLRVLSASQFQEATGA